ncbi:MAG: cytochrome P450 [Actinobacteria bacterium]|nr:cytochrome P450 [Actinomycetota bacterium]
MPYETFAHLRATSPVHRFPEPTRKILGFNGQWVESTGPGYWAVTRHADVVHVSRHPELFSSWLGGTQIFDPPNQMELDNFRQMMLNMDPPQHSKLRRIVQKAFVPRAIERLKASVDANAAEIVDEFAAKGGGDFVEEVAADLPLRVLADLLGVPREDRHLLFDWSNRLIASDDPEFGGGDPLQFAAAFMEMFSYGNDIAEDRRANPRDDLVSVIANAEVEGERLTQVEFNMFWMLLVIAGNETTRNLLSGGTLALIEHPDQRDRLIADRELLPTAIEEMLRFVTPVIHFRRTATEDTEVAGQPIAAGDKVVVYYVSANRDEDAFDRPDEFDVGRTPNEHVAFGVGPHFCLGAHLARQEIGAMFGLLLERTPRLALAGPVERMQSAFIHGIKHLPVEVGA